MRNAKRRRTEREVSSLEENVVQPSEVEAQEVANSRDYEKAYCEGHAAGNEVENAVKRYKSHRRVFHED